MNEGVLTTPEGWRDNVKDYLSLERNVSIASATVLLLGFGEELWKKFLPKYLEALGASIPVIGIFGAVRSLSITPAAAIGELRWKVGPQVPFIIAGIIGFIGTVVFAVTVEKRYAS